MGLMVFLILVRRVCGLTEGLGMAWEYGQGILETAGPVADVVTKDVGAAIRALEPYVSDKRRLQFEKVIAQRTTRLRVAYERPSNPSNVWACLRTIDAFGIQCVDIVADSREEARRRAERRGATGTMFQSREVGMKSALGAQKWLTLRRHATTETMIRELRGDGYSVCVTDLADDAEDIYSWTPPDQGKIALVFGNEEIGISDHLRSGADCRLRIPMKGFAESLNLSVSTAAFLAHLAAKGYMIPDLDPAVAAHLKLRWLASSVRAAEPILRREGLLL